MTESQNYIVKLAKAALFDEVPEIPADGIDWEYIWTKSHEQNIAGFIASAVLRLPAEYQPDNAAAWNEAMLQTMFVMSRRFVEFERMAAVMQKNGIEPICLKGIVIKDLYPVPELRLMSDFDILISGEQRSKAEKLFEESGYSIIVDTLYFAAKGPAYWEVFCSLENEFRVNSAEYDKLLSDNSVKYKNNVKTISDTYFFAHLIVHAAKHILHKGAGIRSICDIALFISRNDVDYSIVENICREQNCLKVYSYIMLCMRKFFGLDVVADEKLDADLFMEYLLFYGVFGKETNGNVLMPQAAKNEEDISYIRKILFPPVKMLDYKYRYLKKRPYLLPVAWVHRVFEGRRRWGYSIPSMIKSFKGVSEYSKERNEWVTKLDLKGDK